VERRRGGVRAGGSVSDARGTPADEAVHCRQRGGVWQLGRDSGDGLLGRVLMTLVAFGQHAAARRGLVALLATQEIEAGATIGIGLGGEVGGGLAVLGWSWRGRRSGHCDGRQVGVDSKGVTGKLSRRRDLVLVGWEPCRAGTFALGVQQKVTLEQRSQVTVADARGSVGLAERVSGTRSAEGMGGWPAGRAGAILPLGGNEGERECERKGKRKAARQRLRPLQKPLEAAGYCRSRTARTSRL
jgi:hypothetical protein